MKQQNIKVITPSTEGLRSILLETLADFVNGKVDHIHAKTVAKMCDSVNKSLSIDIEAARFVREGGAASIADLNLNMALVKPVILVANEGRAS